MKGALLVAKPPGMTSHDVVDFFRRLTGVKAGHTGTLDTAAAGLLVLCVGPATRLAQYLVGCDKTYWAEICFGLRTDSGDAEGQVIERSSAEGLTAEQVTTALAGLVGTLSLPVPQHSAVRLAGKPLHRRVRRGEAVTVPYREMQVQRWTLRDFRPGPLAVARTELDCGSGTYVRTLAQALGEAVQIPAYLSFLVRTRVGQFLLEQAHTLEEIEQAAERELLQSLLLTPAQTVSHLPALRLEQEQVRRAAHGSAVAVPAEPTARPALREGEPVRLLDPAGRLVAVARVTAGADTSLLQPETVLAET